MPNREWDTLPNRIFLPALTLPPQPKLRVIQRHETVQKLPPLPAIIAISITTITMENIDLQIPSVLLPIILTNPHIRDQFVDPAIWIRNLNAINPERRFTRAQYEELWSREVNDPKTLGDLNLEAFLRDACNAGVKDIRNTELLLRKEVDGVAQNIGKLVLLESMKFMEIEITRIEVERKRKAQEIDAGKGKRKAEELVADPETIEDVPSIWTRQAQALGGVARRARAVGEVCPSTITQMSWIIANHFFQETGDIPNNEADSPEEQARPRKRVRLQNDPDNDVHSHHPGAPPGPCDAQAPHPQAALFAWRRANRPPYADRKRLAKEKNEQNAERELRAQQQPHRDEAHNSRPSRVERRQHCQWSEHSTAPEPMHEQIGEIVEELNMIPAGLKPKLRLAPLFEHPAAQEWMREPSREIDILGAADRVPMTEADYKALGDNGRRKAQEEKAKRQREFSESLGNGDGLWYDDGEGF